MTWLTAAPFAHRGLHGPGVPENSLSAFAAARRAGFGVELDVRITQDGVVTVFHDASLRRMTGRRDALASSKFNDLRDLRLKNSGEPIPTLEQALETLGNGVPILVELKPDDRLGDRLARLTCDQVKRFGGRVAIMSSSIAAIRLVYAREPTMVCGRVVGRADVAKLDGPDQSWPGEELSFVAYDGRALPNPSADKARDAGLPVLAWTVRSRRIQARLHDHVDNIIFEKYLPQTREIRT